MNVLGSSLHSPAVTTDQMLLVSMQDPGILLERPPALKEVQNPGRLGLTPTQSLPPPKDGQVCQPLMVPAAMQTPVRLLVPAAVACLLAVPSVAHAHPSCGTWVSLTQAQCPLVSPGAVRTAAEPHYTSCSRTIKESRAP